jgi:hypothetical protein
MSFVPGNFVIRPAPLREYHIPLNAIPAGPRPAHSIMQDARGPRIPGGGI